MEFKFLQYEVAGGLVTITINRPPHNVLDIPTMEEMNRAVERAAAEKDAKVVMITGAGEKAFSAGVEVADHTPDKVDRMLEVFHAIFAKLQAVPVPTVAALNGVALGGGCELALGCDMIVAASNAKLGQPEVKLAVFPPVAAVLMPRLLPSAKAMELLLGGNNLDADEAQRLGLVNRVFLKESFRNDVMGFLQQFLELSRPALVYTKKAILQAAGRPFGPALAGAEKIYLDELMKTEDAKEGLKAFLEKRKPVWKNR